MLRLPILAVLLVALGCSRPPEQSAAPSLALPTRLPPTETPYSLPTPPPGPTPVCAGAPLQRLILQERARVLADDPRPVNLRAAPGTDAAVLEQIPIRAVLLVVAGPRCEGAFTWYQVRYNGQEGWIAEGDLTGYYVEPYLVG
jgi:hypothetical protein